MMCDKPTYKQALIRNIYQGTYTKLHYNPYGTSNDKSDNKKISSKKQNTQQLINPITQHQHLITKQLPQKSHNVRFGYINANGIKTTNSDRYMEILKYIKESKCDVFGITETNIHWNDGEIYRKLTKEAKKNNQQYTHHNHTI